MKRLTKTTLAIFLLTAAVLALAIFSNASAVWGS